MSVISWNIESLEYTNDADQVVTRAHWRCSVSEEVGETLYTAADSRAVFLDEIKADASGFIAYSDLTEAKCLDWIWAKTDKAKVETALKEDIAKQRNPPLKSGRPWS
tara:strand:- start:4863 stop:5183 length:321 start_codon:yes stop_codon:yes gene_type:complete